MRHHTDVVRIFLLYVLTVYSSIFQSEGHFVGVIEITFEKYSRDQPLEPFLYRWTGEFHANPVSIFQYNPHPRYQGAL